jgi:hypothetical protein
MCHRRYVSEVDASNEDIAQPFKQLLVHPFACEVHEVEKEMAGHRTSADFRVLFAFFDAGNLA